MVANNEDVAPEIVWHYTTWRGLQGILGSKAIWASHLEFLNDQKEFNLAVETAVNVLQRSFPDDLEQRRRERVERASTWLGRTQKRALCVASFSTEGDDLSQWRAYSKGHVGIAIGFESRRLLEIAAREEGRFVRCLYCADEHRGLLEPALKDLVDAINAPIENHERYCNDVERVWFNAMRDLFTHATRIKHGAFFGEREWRLVVPSQGRDWGFHESHSLAVPHVQVDLSIDEPRRIPIVEIRVGPCPHLDAMSTAVRLLTKQYGHELACTHTAVPYRNW